MTVSTEWTLSERLFVIQAIAARMDSMVTTNALKHRHEIANDAFLIRYVAIQPARSIEANREQVLAAAGFNEKGQPEGQPL